MVRVVLSNSVWVVRGQFTFLVGPNSVVARGMAKPTVKTFVEMVQRSKLVEEELLRQTLLGCKERLGERFAEDVDGVADYLRESGVLTRWHCEKILAGKYKGFFLGRYKLLDLLGAGGMSSVYLAEHQVMRRKAAIKVLPKRRLGNASYLARFQLEAQAIAHLDHPNVVRAYDIDQAGDNHYIVLEYVRGRDLQALVQRDGPLSFYMAAGVISQAARALDYAHGKGLIHRDVKPGNLLIDDSGMVKILDLGLALFADDERASLTIEHRENVLGTADYLAPEQALDSHSVDARADVYGLGCTLYYALTGHAPFPEGSLAQRIARHQSQMPPDIRLDRPDCPEELLALCARMIRKRPEERVQTCGEVAEILEGWLRGADSASSRVSGASVQAVAIGASLGGPPPNPRLNGGMGADFVGSEPPLPVASASSPTRVSGSALDDTVPDRKRLVEGGGRPGLTSQSSASSNVHSGVRVAGEVLDPAREQDAGVTTILVAPSSTHGIAPNRWMTGLAQLPWWVWTIVGAAGFIAAAVAVLSRNG